MDGYVSKPIQIQNCLRGDCLGVWLRYEEPTAVAPPWSVSGRHETQNRFGLEAKITSRSGYSHKGSPLVPDLSRSRTCENGCCHTE